MPGIIHLEKTRVHDPIWSHEDHKRFYLKEASECHSPEGKKRRNITVSDRNDPIAIISAFKNSPLSILSSPTNKIEEPKFSRKKKLSSAMNILKEDRNKR
jgi:hypothetical protein